MKGIGALHRPRLKVVRKSRIRCDPVLKGKVSLRALRLLIPKVFIGLTTSLALKDDPEPSHP